MDIHLALHAALAEIRAVGTNSAGIRHLHSLRPTTGAWRMSAWPEIAKACESASRDVEKMLRAEIASKNTSPAQAGDEHAHLVFLRLAAKYPNIFTYERTRI